MRLDIGKLFNYVGIRILICQHKSIANSTKLYEPTSVLEFQTSTVVMPIVLLLHGTSFMQHRSYANSTVIARHFFYAAP